MTITCPVCRTELELPEKGARHLITRPTWRIYPACDGCGEPLEFRPINRNALTVGMQVRVYRPKVRSWMCGDRGCERVGMGVLRGGKS